MFTALKIGFAALAIAGLALSATGAQAHHPHHLKPYVLYELADAYTQDGYPGDLYWDYDGYDVYDGYGYWDHHGGHGHGGHNQQPAPVEAAPAK